MGGSGSNLKIKVLVSLWSLMILGSFFALWGYSNRPGPAGSPPTLWPKQSQIQLISNKPNLIVFAHPHCSCSRATIGELRKLNAKFGKDMKVDIVFYHPEKFDRSWVTDSDLYQIASSMKDVTLHIDSHQNEINLFHPKTSGQTYFYHSNGKLLYSGGLTSARGHEGDNIGSDVISTWMRTQELIEHEALVFGCTLFHDGEEA